MKPIIGVDFDNTIVCYHDLLHKVAVEQNWIPESFPKCKAEIRNFLRARGLESQWTLMQGMVYGERLIEAPPFPGVVDFFKAMLDHDVKIYIISHKTRYPYAVELKCDLHEAARQWLDYHLLAHLDKRLDHCSIFFNESLDSKLENIQQKSCSHFIDDLPEVLLDARFPATTEKLLFSNKQELGLKHFLTWQMLQDYVLSSL